MTKPLRKLQRRMERHENRCRREHAQLQHDVTRMLALLVPAEERTGLLAPGGYKWATGVDADGVRHDLRAPEQDS